MTSAQIEPDLISVVIPARNEQDHIGATLDAVCAQTKTNLQIIVIDNASTDRTAEIVHARAADDDRIELLTNPEVSIPKSLNLALQHARGRWFVRVDAHSTVPRDYVEKATRRLEEGRWGGVGGRKDAVGITAAGRAIATAMASPFGVGNSVYHYGTRVQTIDHVPFGSYDTALLRELGGWDENLVANEDYELDYRLRRAGHELLFDPDISISWQCRQSIPDLWRQYRRYGRGKADVARLHPESLGLRHLAAPALVAAWSFALLPGKRRRRRLASAVAPYVTALAFATARAMPTLDARASRGALPAAFAAMHIGWGVGFWEQIIRNALDARGTHDDTAAARDSSSRGGSGDVVPESL